MEPAPLPEPFASVRVRHPDADLVLLGPRGGRAGPGPAASGAEAGAAAALAHDLARVAAAACRLGPLAGTVLGPPRARLRFGADEATVRATARLAAPPPDPLRAPPAADQFARLAGALRREGWWVRAAPSAAHLMLARPGPGAEPLTVVAGCAGAGLLRLDVTGPPRRVGVARARALVSG